MIILNEKDLYVSCACGTKFIAMESDFSLNPFTKKPFVFCPTCNETYYVYATEFDYEKPEIKGEKCETD